ncbi:alpha-N-acetylgalactosaminide alpha-2,6-sialyltransferase 1-like isoform X2 [Dunckerocampus dactyliophorus]|uniref:alpha-N-acetylgalactosaminide alpha-2,6-sialyltransferase 1-like isoform X2 n=1 Tax=Dunckerocampus dactyliophorus TaxID=161453 RepID=UPI002404AA88|nr:alpha-N-acetylgalactosaminide alpha-2,6-sialyltransferase 1-like isoform X2 [Dunckerocampus dactyliophorus]
MAFHASRIFILLLVASLSAMFFVLYQSKLSRDISWTTFSRKFNLALEDRSFETKATTCRAPSYDSSVTSMPPAELETPMPVLLKAKFSKLPVWDFEDIYNQDAPPRQSTCRQSLRNSPDESFRKAFLPNMRLFLHKNNINMSEWNRLSHFNNPFGFMGFTYGDVMSSVKLIPRPKEPLLLPKPGGDGCIRCAVVGTAGILNGSKMGKEIDAHDYVFRVNGAVIKGYEDDVGNKTSVYVHTAHSITTSLYLFKKYGYKSAPHDEGIRYVIIPEGMRDFQWLGGLLRGDRVPLGPYKGKRFLKSPHLNARYWAIVRPTNGAFTIFLALHTCDTVDAYGFMTQDYAKYSNYYFERGGKSRVVFYANHDYVLEMKTWKKLHDSKIMRLYQRTEQEAVG